MTWDKIFYKLKHCTKENERKYGRGVDADYGEENASEGEEKLRKILY